MACVLRLKTKKMKKKSSISSIFVFLIIAALSASINAATVEIEIQPFPAGAGKVEILETGKTVSPDASGKAVFSDLSPGDYNFCYIQDDIEDVCREIEIVTSDTVIQFTMEVTYAHPDSLYGTGQTTEISDTAAASDDSGTAALTVEDSVPESSVIETRKEPKDSATYTIEKMTVEGKTVKKRDLGKQTISQKTLQRMPVLAEPDVMRVIQMQPGVVSSSDFSNKIYVRGGASDQNLILLDNAVIYNPSHFGGLFSTFTVGAIKEMAFYKGGFPVNYGNRLSSVLDVSQRRGKEGLLHGNLGVSLLSARAGLEGQVSKFSWMANYRRTYIDYVTNAAADAGIIRTGIPYDFDDLQLYTDFTPVDRFKLSYTQYKGRDQLNFEDLMLLDWGNEMHVGNMRVNPMENLVSHTTLYHTKFDQIIEIGDFVRLYNDIQELCVKHRFTLEYGNHKFGLGGEANRYRVMFKQTMITVDTLEFTDSLESDVAACYVQDEWDVTPQLKMNAGFRATDYRPTAYYGFEPRLGLSFQFREDLELMGHVGRYQQYLTSIMFGDQEMPTEFWYLVGGNMEVPTSILYSGGFKKDFDDDMFVQIETYYKDFDNLPIFTSDPQTDASPSESQEMTMFDFFRPADGFASGFEASLERTDGWLTGNIGYSLGFAVINDRDTLRYANWDKRHNFKITGTFSFLDFLEPGNDSRMKFLSTFYASLGTGLPHTATVGIAEKRDFYTNRFGYYEIKGTRNANRYPLYKRVDLVPLRFEYTGTRFKGSAYWSIINIFDWENVYLYFYETEQGEKPVREEVTMLPRIPIFIGFDLEF